ncbi:MAG: hypothetical protein NUW37_07380 [Planctomycetes bacterium]|nr:hypothetical protein [Planctomycetota bacterium]
MNFRDLARVSLVLAFALNATSACSSDGQVSATFRDRLKEFVPAGYEVLDLPRKQFYPGDFVSGSEIAGFEAELSRADLQNDIRVEIPTPDKFQTVQLKNVSGSDKSGIEFIANAVSMTYQGTPFDAGAGFEASGVSSYTASFGKTWTYSLTKESIRRAVEDYSRSHGTDHPNVARMKSWRVILESIEVDGLEFNFETEDNKSIDANAISLLLDIKAEIVTENKNAGTFELPASGVIAIKTIPVDESWIVD